MNCATIRCLLLVASVGISLLVALNAVATTLTPGGFQQREDHSNENHSNEFLNGIDLSGGSLALSNVKNTSFVGGFFVGTDLSGANLQWVDFSGADLRNAIFSPDTNLKNGDLSGATLYGIDLTGVNIAGVDFTGAFYNGTETLLFDPVAAGMILAPEPSPLTMILAGLIGLAVLRRESTLLVS